MTIMTSRIRKCRRYDNDHTTLQRPCSSDPDNPGLKPGTTTPAVPTGRPPHQSHIRMQTSSIPSATHSSDQTPSSPPQVASITQKRRKGSPPAPEQHQPIGFVCCHCRYHSSGSYCSNPEYASCPHKNLPRCRNCPIIFTPSRARRQDTCEDG
ncbi:hypothetical protein F4803DRAFT_500060 [Xylaria telfairii]|nr:hypothetical protein F4803DRAFT_500060 [Xylaria telfairii]